MARCPGRPWFRIWLWAGWLAACTVAPAAAAAPNPHELVIATVDNGHMVTLQRLAMHFEQHHPGVKLRWVVLGEGQLRQRVSAALATQSDAFDVVTVGTLQTPIWAARGWLLPAEVAAPDDLLPPVREALSQKGRLYAAPLYGESSMTLYRRDLFEAAGLTLSNPPTWTEIRAAAQRLHDPQAGIYGICLRGRPGWGENIPLISQMVNSFGGRWFDMNWQAQLDAPAWLSAVNLYLELLQRFGPPGAVANGYNENLALFEAGRCAIWVDATVAAGFVNDPARSRVAGRVGWSMAPVAVTERGSHWLWAWALAVPQRSRHPETAQAFVRWATSPAYVRLVAQEAGWHAVPSGTRRSTYAEPAYRAVNPQADLVLKAILTADPHNATLLPVPYAGIQFVAIPEFQAIGTGVGALLAQALTGHLSAAEALRRAQVMVEAKMRDHPPPSAPHALAPGPGPSVAPRPGAASAAGGPAAEAAEPPPRTPQPTR